MAELRYEGILFDSLHVAEERDGRAVASVPRDEIRSIELKRGPPGERLSLQIAFAGLLLVLGLLAVGIFIGELSDPAARIHVNIGLGAIFIPISALVLWAALRPAYYLAVRTDKDLRKLAFLRSAKPDEIDALMKRAARELSYPV